MDLRLAVILSVFWQGVVPPSTCACDTRDLSDRGHRASCDAGCVETARACCRDSARLCAGTKDEQRQACDCSVVCLCGTPQEERVPAVPPGNPRLVSFDWPPILADAARLEPVADAARGSWRTRDGLEPSFTSHNQRQAQLAVWLD